MWGADHHGHITRMRIAWEALGGDPDAFEILIMQLVKLTESGEQVTMSKRAGAIVTLDDLLDEIGGGAAGRVPPPGRHASARPKDPRPPRGQSEGQPRA